ncbi:MAG: energy transducer TonB [Bacteroidales bacterium]|jgi:protein TonB|nr:energy transducer TonB [Bacteroidales bacterium]
MKKLVSILAGAALLLVAASCSHKPSAEAVEAAAVKNATDLVTAVMANDTDNIKAALGADAAAYATLGISEEKTPELVALYNDTYENTLEDNGVVKDAILEILKKRGIEIPVGPQAEVKVEGEEPSAEGEEKPLEELADSLSTDMEAVKEITEEAANNVIEAIGDYSAADIKVEEEVAEEIPEVIPYIVVEKKPTFNGGDANGFAKWINSQIVYPEGAKERKAEGRVVVTFKVGADGQIKDVALAKGVDPEIDAEVLRVVKSAPAWTPGEQNGKPVDVSYTCPLVFKLQ